MRNDVTDAWNEYLYGTEFKNSINLYAIVNENLRFYEGDQWRGNTDSLPTPVVNMIKRACKFMAVQIKDKKLAMNYTAEGTGETPDIDALLEQMKQYSRETWRRLKMEQKNLDGLMDAFNTGDYILYHWWNDSIETGQKFTGDIDNMEIDNVNYYPGNPNSADVQSQPYIILCMRQLVSEVRALAKKNGASDADIQKITGDNEYEYQAGDVGKIELTQSNKNLGKCNLLLRMWKKDGEVYFAKYTRLVEVQKPKKADLSLYPIAMMNWDRKKNCCHGAAETTYLKSNQVYVNKQLALNQLYLLQNAYPKVLYDGSVLPDGWNTKLSSAVKVNGDVNNAARFMNPPQIPYDIWKAPDVMITNTMNMMGANDVALGNISNPDNQSAFIAVREQAVVALQAQQERFYQMMKDVGMIWLDFWLHKYPPGRNITVTMDGKRTAFDFELAKYKNLVFDADIEIGESQMWSELNVVSTLNNLLQYGNGALPLSMFFKLLPYGYIPNKDELYNMALQKEQEQA